MSTKILIEVDLGLKSLERRDVFVYIDSKLAEGHFDVAYEDLPRLVEKFRQEYPTAQIEVWGSGEDCCGRVHRWELTF